MAIIQSQEPFKDVKQIQFVGNPHTKKKSLSTKKRKKIVTLGDFIEEYNRQARENGTPEAVLRKDPPTHEVSVCFINRPKL